MSANDARPTPHTDALDSLGFIHKKKEHRDAIHLAVEQVTAAEKLRPGQDIGFYPDGTVGANAEKLLGIVDPFIRRPVQIGDQFWLVVYPRQISSLYHVWEHPDFPPSGVTRG